MSTAKVVQVFYSTKELREFLKIISPPLHLRRAWAFFMLFLPDIGGWKIENYLTKKRRKFETFGFFPPLASVIEWVSGNYASDRPHSMRLSARSSPSALNQPTDYLFAKLRNMPTVPCITHIKKCRVLIESIHKKRGELQKQHTPTKKTFESNYLRFKYWNNTTINDADRETLTTDG